MTDQEWSYPPPDYEAVLIARDAAGNAMFWQVIGGHLSPGDSVDVPEKFPMAADAKEIGYFPRVGDYRIEGQQVLVTVGPFVQTSALPTN